MGMPWRSKTFNTPACAMPRANPPPSARPRRGATAAAGASRRRVRRWIAAYEARRLPIAPQEAKGPLPSESVDADPQQFAGHRSMRKIRVLGNRRVTVGYEIGAIALMTAGTLVSPSEDREIVIFLNTTHRPEQP